MSNIFQKHHVLAQYYLIYDKIYVAYYPRCEMYLVDTSLLSNSRKKTHGFMSLLIFLLHL